MVDTNTELFSFIASVFSKFGNVTYVKEKNACETDVRVVFREKSFDPREIWFIAQDVDWHVGSWRSEGGNTYLITFVCANCDYCCD